MNPILRFGQVYSVLGVILRKMMLRPLLLWVNVAAPKREKVFHAVASGILEGRAVLLWKNMKK